MLYVICHTATDHEFKTQDITLEQAIKEAKAFIPFGSIAIMEIRKLPDKELVASVDSNGKVWVRR